MTIKELYELSKVSNIEDYQIKVFDEWDECAYPFEEGKLKIDKEKKSIVIGL